MDLWVLEMLPMGLRALYSICTEGTVVSESAGSNPAIPLTSFMSLGKLLSPM